MITNSDSTLIDLQAEITKNKKLLDKVYVDVENLKKDKGVIEGDIMTITKHLTYLEEVKAIKDREIAEKEQTIVGLDSQVVDKAKRRDNLEHDINAFETSLQEKRSEFADLEVKLADHAKFLEETTKTANDLHAHAKLTHDAVDEKVRKIEALLAELK